MVGFERGLRGGRRSALMVSMGATEARELLIDPRDLAPLLDSIAILNHRTVRRKFRAGEEVDF